MILRNQHVLKPGDSGPAVREIQQFLRQQPVDGNYGAALRQAIMSFQTQKHLKTSAGREGFVGTTTMRCMLGAWPGCEIGGTAAPAAQGGGAGGNNGGAAGGKYPGCNPSSAALAQMESFYQYANTHHNGASRGRCWEWVWKYMMAKG